MGLCTIQEVPEYRKVDYILSGYRYRPVSKAPKSTATSKTLQDSQLDYPYLECAKSLFTLHNESINIWTHLLAGAFFLLQGWTEVNRMKQVLPPMESVIESQKIVLIYSISMTISFLGSAIFHWFNACSKKIHWRLRVVDFTGISFHIIGSQIALMYFTFFCYPNIQRTYVMSFVFLTIFGVVFPFFDLFHTPRFRKLRIAVFVLMSSYPVLMYIHTFIIGLDDSVNELYKGMALTYFWYLIGLYFYGSRWPESKWPGRFDIWFASHQVWHCVAFIAAFTWFSSFSQYMYYRLSIPCE